MCVLSFSVLRNPAMQLPSALFILFIAVISLFVIIAVSQYRRIRSILYCITKPLPPPPLPTRPWLRLVCLKLKAFCNSVTGFCIGACTIDCTPVNTADVCLFSSAINLQHTIYLVSIPMHYYYCLLFLPENPATIFKSRISDFLVVRHSVTMYCISYLNII